MKKILIFILLGISISLSAKTVNIDFNTASFHSVEAVCNNLISSAIPTIKTLQKAQVFTEILSCDLVEEGTISNDYVLSLEVSGLDCKSEDYKLIKTTNFSINILNKIEGTKFFQERINGKLTKNYYVAVRNCRK